MGIFNDIINDIAEEPWLIPESPEREDFLFFRGSSHRSISMYRCLIASYWSIWILISILGSVGVPLPDALFGNMDNDMGEKWLIFLTNWSMVLLGTYLWTAFAASLYTDHSPRLLQTVWVLRNCTAVAALVVSLLFWCVLFPAIKKTSWTDVHCHAVNSFLVLLDLTLTHVPYYFKHGWMPFLYLVLYLLFSVVYWAEGGTDPEGDPYIYEPLDYDHPGAATGLVLAVVFLVVPFVHVSLYAYTRCLSQGLCQACFGEGGKMGRREGARTDRLPLLPA